MDTARNENPGLLYIKQIVTEVMGEELWNGFYDVVTSERPRIDMYDDGTNILILGEIPGVLDPADMSITVSSNLLNIKGISRDKYQLERPGKILKSECLYGPFDRTLELPYPVYEKSITAVYENGILEITMKRASVDEGKNIKIEFKK